MADDKLDFRYLVRKALSYWYFFVLGMALALLAGYYYLKVTPPGYSAYSMILIKNDEGSGQISEEALFAELGLGRKNQNLENESIVIRSTPLMRQVVDQLNLQNFYYKINRFGLRDLYKQSPVQILDWQPVHDLIVLYGELEADDKGSFKLVVDEQEYQGEFGKPLKLPNGSLTLTRVQEFPMEGRYAIQIFPPRLIAESFSKRLGVEIVGEESSTLLLSFHDESAKRASDILMALMTTYNRNSVDQKNQVFKNSIDLINERVQLINQELTAAERDLESYKRRFSMTELSSEGNILLTELTASNRQLMDAEVQLEILNSIETFLERNRDNFTFVPTNLTINNLTLTEQISTFNRVLQEREALRSQYGPQHPDLILAERQIRNLRETIIDNINTIRKDLEIARNASENMNNNLQTRIQSLPQRERELVEMTREKGVKENLFLYLLQKREESAISLAVTQPSGQIVQPAEVPLHPTTPKRIQIWLIAAFLGLALPAGLAVLLENLNDKVQNEEDIERITDVPIVGTLAYTRKKDKLVVRENSHSIMAEMFRLLRANLAYITPGKQLHTLLITSSMSGEGKSFIALNLGMTQALAGRRVLIIDLDLRRPKQEEYLNGSRGDMGIVNYLVDPTVDIDAIRRNSGAHPNLDVIMSGPKPPNPSELLLSERLRELLDMLREEYDFIILDTPPVGLVADALQIKDLAEATMYVVRAETTRKGQMHIIADIADKQKLPQPFVVLNAFRVNKNGGYGGRYSYGQYGSGYYSSEE